MIRGVNFFLLFVFDIYKFSSQSFLLSLASFFIIHFWVSLLHIMYIYITYNGYEKFYYYILYKQVLVSTVPNFIVRLMLTFKSSLLSFFFIVITVLPTPSLFVSKEDFQTVLFGSFYKSNHCVVICFRQFQPKKFSAKTERDNLKVLNKTKILIKVPSHLKQ